MPDLGDAGTDAHHDAPTDTFVVPGSWAKQIPGTGFESVDSIAVAGDGSVFLAGSFDGTLDLGGGPLTATGTQDLFIAKFSSAGEHVWSRRYGGSSTTGATKIAVLSNGDLAVAGGYRGTITLGATMLTSVGDQDVFVSRLSGTGDPIWAVTGGTTAFDSMHDMSVDPNDNIAICGGFSGTGTFFGTSIAGSNDAWLVRITGAGATSWAKGMAAGGIVDTCGVAAMANGDVVFVGSFNGTVNAGGLTFTSTSNSLDMYMVRYAATNGAHVWSVPRGGAGNDEAFDVEPSGNSIVVTGRYSSSINFGGNTLTSAGGDDAFVAMFDAANGNHQFSTSMGGLSNDVGLRLSVRSDGQVSVAGQFAGSANFGGTMLMSNGDIDPFVVDVDGTTGAITAVKSVGGPSRDEAHDVFSTADSLVFAGSFTTSIMMLNQPYTSMGAEDGYVIRFKR